MTERGRSRIPVHDNVLKRSAALLIEKSGRVLLVKRPLEDAELPGVWGLPACSLEAEESWRQAARRCARVKLGVQLKAVELAGGGRQERSDYALHMRLFSARLTAGEKPKVPQPDAEMTQYSACRWAPKSEALDVFKKGAGQGSLCCALAVKRME